MSEGLSGECGAVGSEEGPERDVEDSGSSEQRLLGETSRECWERTAGDPEREDQGVLRGMRKIPEAQSRGSWEGAGNAGN